MKPEKPFEIKSNCPQSGNIMIAIIGAQGERDTIAQLITLALNGYYFPSSVLSQLPEDVQNSPEGQKALEAQKQLEAAQKLLQSQRKPINPNTPQ